MLFDGIFEEGKPDGKGKEYRFDGSLAFEGEFIKGERTGRGLVLERMAANFSMEILSKEVARVREQNTAKMEHSFQRSFLKDQRHGIGSIYGPDEAIVFKGNFDQGKPQGAGQEFRDDGTMVYDGNFVEGQRQGQGKLFSMRGELIFEGEFLANLGKVRGLSTTKTDQTL